jgi:hypothetical protein
MVGKGFYNGHSDAQSEGIRQQEARLRNAARCVDLAGPELRLVDYGCGPGRNSVEAVHAVLDEGRAATRICRSSPCTTTRSATTGAT